MLRKLLNAPGRLTTPGQAPPVARHHGHPHEPAAKSPRLEGEDSDEGKARRLLRTRAGTEIKALSSHPLRKTVAKSIAMRIKTMMGPLSRKSLMMTTVGPQVDCLRLFVSLALLDVASL